MQFGEDVETLVERLADATILLKKAKSADERLALGHYIWCMYDALVATIGVPLNYSDKDIFGSVKNGKKYDKKTMIFRDRALKNFFENRDYHKKMLGSIINDLSGNLNFMEDQYTCMKECLSKGEFFDIFSSFLKSLNLGKDFDKFIKNVGIYSFYGEVMPSAAGFILFNPVDKSVDVFSSNANYDVRTLSTLAHEFGHAYDYSKFDGDYIDFNKYLHRSFYTEVTSVLFERLMIEYLINNDILINDAKDELIAKNSNHYWMLIGGYIDSLLDYDMLKKNQQDKYSSEYIYSLIKKNFNEDIKSFLERISTLNVIHNHIYTYGDIISMIIKDNVDKYGFDNDMLLEMYDRRGEIFSPEFLDKNGVTPENYIKGYQKELKLLEK
ncbi:MAG: hypothetical protein IJI58_05400 [Bacilli bacterium]|nr:hypothetical protein [Bacilli bacterium]